MQSAWRIAEYSLLEASFADQSPLPLLFLSREVKPDSYPFAALLELIVGSGDDLRQCEQELWIGGLGAEAVEAQDHALAGPELPVLALIIQWIADRGETVEKAFPVPFISVRQSQLESELIVQRFFGAQRAGVDDVRGVMEFGQGTSHGGSLSKLLRGCCVA